MKEWRYSSTILDLFKDAIGILDYRPIASSSRIMNWKGSGRNVEEVASGTSTYSASYTLGPNNFPNANNLCKTPRSMTPKFLKVSSCLVSCLESQKAIISLTKREKFT
jgi:hypothetical protein